MVMVACPDCGEQVLEGVRSCPFCESRARSVFAGSGPAFRPFAAGGKSWGSSTFLTAGIVAAVVSGLAWGYYDGHSDESGWLSVATGAAVLALIWLLIGAVARGVAVGMREHDEG